MQNKLEYFWEFALATPQRSLILYPDAQELEHIKRSFSKKEHTGKVLESVSELSGQAEILLWAPNKSRFLDELDTFNALNDLSIICVALSEKDFEELEEELQEEMLKNLSPIFRY